MRRNPSSLVSSNDQFKDLLMFDDNYRDAVTTVYDGLDLDLAQFISTDLKGPGSSINGITANVDLSGRIIIKINNPTNGMEYFHFSLFTQNNRYGGLHLTCPDGTQKGKKIYLTNAEVLICCGKDSKYIISNLINTLTYYFKYGIRRNGGELPDFVLKFINCCLSKSAEAKKHIIDLLEKLKAKFEIYIPFKCSKNQPNHCNTYHPYRPRHGGSTKLVIYLVKIEKLRELNKKLRKNKTKNKNKIEKNNKRIDEFKEKLKKEKAKAKEKLKKEKAKLKKLKVKKVHITKKIKK